MKNKVLWMKHEKINLNNDKKGFEFWREEERKVRNCKKNSEKTKSNGKCKKS